MMNQQVACFKCLKLEKEGYNPFIDYLKAYSIICVVLAHAIPVRFFDYIQFMVWGDMQVPMFVLIQTFHAYKKGICPSVSFGKIWKRILLPFLFVQLFMFIGLTLGSSQNTLEIIKKSIIHGGNGPGSYYPWVYLQITLILPLLWGMLNKLSPQKLLCVFVITCVILDIICSLIHLSEWLYRLLAIRYFFLIYLGWIWVKDGIKLNLINLILSIISIVAVLFFVYNNSDLEPLFFTTGWKSHRWLCYFYVAYLMPLILYRFYSRTEKFVFFKRHILKIGECSYEIFLVQMMVFVFLPPLVNRLISPGMTRLCIIFIGEVGLSIFMGILFQKYINPFFQKLH